MFICSITLTKEKLAFLLAIFLIAILILGTGISFFGADRYFTHTARRRFLAQYGWQTEEKPTLEETLTLPYPLDDIYLEYEALQNQQGFSLLPYLGKTLKKYTYPVTNYPNAKHPVYANLLVYRGQLVACDIVCPDFTDGFLEPAVRSPMVGEEENPSENLPSK